MWVRVGTAPSSQYSQACIPIELNKNFLVYGGENGMASANGSCRSDGNYYILEVLVTRTWEKEYEERGSWKVRRNKEWGDGIKVIGTVRGLSWRTYPTVSLEQPGRGERDGSEILDGSLKVFKFIFLFHIWGQGGLPRSRKLPEIR